MTDQRRRKQRDPLANGLRRVGPAAQEVGQRPCGADAHALRGVVERVEFLDGLDADQVRPAPLTQVVLDDEVGAAGDERGRWVSLEEGDA